MGKPEPESKKKGLLFISSPFFFYAYSLGKFYRLTSNTK